MTDEDLTESAIRSEPIAIEWPISLFGDYCYLYNI